jgi:CDP-paratose 2-epimerase
MKWIVTGVAGFIGCNSAARFLARDDQVVGFDNLSRPGTAHNLEWLRSLGGDFRFSRIDLRDTAAVSELIRTNADADAVLHLAGQVAVTTSLRDPRTDFEINALGTFNVCEAMRLAETRALLVYASTNKVYGSELGELMLVGGRWASCAYPNGVSESHPLDFHTPYACSKGAAEQYVLDYARSYGLRTVSLRQSCIYGTRQFGIEDQGWVAWLTLAALTDTPFTIFGDGRQVRDILDVADVVSAYDACAASPDVACGVALNVGGGGANTLSLLELVSELERRLDRPVRYEFAEPRAGDQRFYVSDVSEIGRRLGWTPSIGVDRGLEGLTAWLESNLSTITGVLRDAKMIVPGVTRRA